MNGAESSTVGSWFAKGDTDLRAAEVLLAAGEALPVVAFHIQQAAEKYLKGYLLARGSGLRRIHDLETLVQEAIESDPDFTEYLDACQRVTEYYIESHYPIGAETTYAESDLALDLAKVQALIALIHSKVNS